jgi:hypothetical protein
MPSSARASDALGRERFGLIVGPAGLQRLSDGVKPAVEVVVQSSAVGQCGAPAVRDAFWRACSYRGSGAMSAPFGHVTVPASASTVTRAKYSGFCSGSNTPRHSRPAKSTSPIIPSSKVKRSRYSPLTSTPTTSCNCSMQSMLRQSSDRLQRFFASGALPVRGLLALVYGRPFCHQRKRPWWQRPRDHGSGRAFWFLRRSWVLQWYHGSVDTERRRAFLDRRAISCQSLDRHWSGRRRCTLSAVEQSARERPNPRLLGFGNADQRSVGCSE